MDILEGFKSVLSGIQVDRQANEKQIKVIQDRINELTLDVANRKKAVEIIKKIVDEIQDTEYEAIATTVTAGLQRIMGPYQFAIETANKTIRFQVKYGEEPWTDLKEARGGTVVTIIAFVLVVYFILRYNLRRFVALDEYFTHVSDVYIENLSLFIKYICDSLGFDILLVTHVKTLAQAADSVLLMKDKGILVPSTITPAVAESRLPKGPSA